MGKLKVQDATDDKRRNAKIRIGPGESNKTTTEHFTIPSVP
jgi:hypothetical protein